MLAAPLWGPALLVSLLSCFLGASPSVPPVPLPNTVRSILVAERRSVAWLSDEGSAPGSCGALRCDAVAFAGVSLDGKPADTTGWLVSIWAKGAPHVGSLPCHWF